MITTSSTLDLLAQMRLHGMRHAYQTALASGTLESTSPDECLATLVHAEWEERQNRRSQYLLNNARFRQSAALEQIDFSANRQGLNKANILQLASCNFIQRGEHILITGPTGVGKSFLATALGNTACLKGFKVLFTSTAKLLTQLLNDKADGTYLKKLNHVTRYNLLILDDFGLHPFQEADQLILYDLIEDMTHKHALILTSQIPVEHWHQLITQSTLADAVMDRIIHNAHRIELKGDSMRKNTIQKD
ncbi:MAG: IS21-like element helper ATPase IstB [Gallionella sp.]|nr:IS21-like element helper ATPase IstB [Gallionella sp.]